MDYQFREIRKGERADVLAFAQANGCTVQADTLRHHLSLTARAGDELIAAGLCIEQEPGRFVIEIISKADDCDEALVTELTDRCLRKVQSEHIGSTRLNSPTQEPTDVIWSNANWLDRIEETPPPNTADGPSSQAA